MPRDEDAPVNLDELRKLEKFKYWTDDEILEEVVEKVRRAKAPLTPEELAELRPDLAPYVKTDGSPDSHNIVPYINTRERRQWEKFSINSEDNSENESEMQCAASRDRKSVSLRMQRTPASAADPSRSMFTAPVMIGIFMVAGLLWLYASHIPDFELLAPQEALGAVVDVDGKEIGKITELMPGRYGYEATWIQSGRVPRGKFLTVTGTDGRRWTVDLRREVLPHLSDKIRVTLDP